MLRGVKEIEGECIINVQGERAQLLTYNVDQMGQVRLEFESPEFTAKMMDLLKHAKPNEVPRVKVTLELPSEPDV